jgi:hypothetical protein
VVRPAGRRSAPACQQFSVSGGWHGAAGGEVGGAELAPRARARTSAHLLLLFVSLSVCGLSSRGLCCPWRAPCCSPGGRDEPPPMCRCRLASTATDTERMWGAQRPPARARARASRSLTRGARRRGPAPPRNADDRPTRAPALDTPLRCRRTHSHPTIHTIHSTQQSSMAHTPTGRSRTPAWRRWQA